MRRASRPRPPPTRRRRAPTPPAPRRMRPRLPSSRARRSCACGGVGLRYPRAFAVDGRASEKEEDDAADDDDEAYELRGREARERRQTPDVAARVVAHELDEEAQKPVEHRVGCDDLTREALTSVQPDEEEKD